MSTRIDELAGELEALRTEMAELDALTEPSEDQAKRYDVALDEWTAKNAEREALVVREEKRAKVREISTEPTNREAGAPNVIIRKDPFEGVESVRMNVDIEGRVHMGSDEVVAKARSAFEGGKFRGVKSDQIEALLERVENVPGVAEHALVHGTPGYRSAFETFMRSHGVNPLYSAEELYALRASLSLSGANGGYTLPTLLDPTLIHVGTATKNPIRRLARVETGTQNVWHGVGVGNVTTYWKAEASAFTDGSPTYTSPAVTAALLSAYVTGSYEIFEDSSQLQQLPGLIGEAMDYEESAAFITGSGSGAPKGIVVALTGTAATVTATTRGAFTTASAVDIFAVTNAMNSRYEDSATWVGNKATFNTIKQMSTGSQGSYFWSDFNEGVGEGQGLLGSPIAKSSTMATAQTSGTTLLVLGDWSQFLIYDRIGTQVEFIQNVVDGSGLPTGQRGLVAHKRVGSDITDVSAFKLLKT